MKNDILADSRMRRRKKLIYTSVFYLIAFLFIFIIVFSFSYIPYFKIKKVSIESDSTFIKTDQLTQYVSNYLDERYLWFIHLNNIFFFPKTRVEQDILRDFPRVKEISIDRDFPNTMRIKIKERKEVVSICYIEDCSFIDTNGFIFEKAPFFSGSIFTKFTDNRSNVERFFIGQQFMDEVEFKNVIKFVSLVKDYNIGISEIILKDNGEYNVITSFGWYILLDKNNDANSAFENFKISYDTKIKDSKKQLEYIDLRFGNKVVFKFN